MSPETRQRVLNAIRELGYKPGVIPGGGAPRQARAIGVFVFLGGLETPLSSSPYAIEVLDGVLATAMPRHWNLTLISVHAWSDARAQVRLFADGRCDGFVLIAPRTEWQIKEALIERGYPCVMINSGTEDATIDTVDIDNYAAAHEVTLRLIGAGHRHIAFLPGGEDLADTNLRIEGYRAAMKAADGDDSGIRVLGPGSYDLSQSRERVRAFLRDRASSPPSERVTALFCGNDQLAFWARNVFQEASISVPDEISLVGFDDLPDAARMHPPLTTVRQPRQLLGARATELLLDRIDDESQSQKSPRTPKSLVLPYEIKWRDSVANLTAAS